MKPHLLLSCIILFGCAHKPSQNNDCDDLTPSQVNDISMLAKTSYARGCVEGMKFLDDKKSRSLRFDQCKKQSFKHYQEIRAILEADLKNQLKKKSRPNN